MIAECHDFRIDLCAFTPASLVPAPLTVRGRWLVSALVAVALGSISPSALAQPTPEPAVATLPGSLGEMAAQFEKSPDTVVAEVDGIPITLGMIADRLRAFPSQMGGFSPTVIYASALDDLIEKRAAAIKARALGLDKLPETIRQIDKLMPEIAAVAFTVSPGRRSAFPVPSNGLWFLIDVEERRQRGTPTLAESRSQLRS